jgi:diketogulonate reductase-like aldo/keto reductase
VRIGPRELFVTMELFISDASYDKALRAFERSMQRLQVRLVS